MARLITAEERSVLADHRRRHPRCLRCGASATVYMFDRYDLPAALCATHEAEEEAALGRITPGITRQ